MQAMRFSSRNSLLWLSKKERKKGTGFNRLQESKIHVILHSIINRAIGQMSRVFASGPGDRGSIPRSSQTKKNGTRCRLT